LKNSDAKIPDHYMRLAIRLAARAVGNTSPNPLVGAVIVRNGKIVGQGYHHHVGGPHAERNALKNAGNKARGADLYLNLEPCIHYGRTPPCVDAVLESGIKRVFVGMTDPNPLVNGKGVQKLREGGVEVKTRILEEECRKLNEAFVKHITTHSPFVIVKAAASLDGRIASETGDSKWITNEKSRQYVHKLRNKVDAVIVGIGTIEKDDPMLTTRLPKGKGKDSVRVVVDSNLKISPQAHVLNLKSSAPTLIFTTPEASLEKIRAIEKEGVEVIVIPSRKRVDLTLVMEALGKRDITSVLIEGGSRINTSAFKEGIVDKVILFYAPRIIGGQKAPLIVGGEGISKVKDALVLHCIKTRRFGDDIMVEGYT